MIGSRYVHSNYFALGLRDDGSVFEMESDDSFYKVASFLEEFAELVVNVR